LSERTPDPVPLLLEAERELRELASELQQPLREVSARDTRRVRRAFDTLMKIYVGDDSWMKVLLGASRAMEDRQLAERVEGTYNVIRAIDLAMQSAHSATSYCERSAVDDPFCVKMTERSEGLQRVQELMAEVEKVTGRRCGFEARIPERRRRYTIPSLLNDLSNCVHVLAEWLPTSGLPTSTRRVARRCYAAEGADERLVRLCERWSDYTEAFERRYQSVDSEPLAGLALDRYATFRVGSSPGHAARVDREGRVFYFEQKEDAIVANALRHVLEAGAGYSCNYTVSDGQFPKLEVSCTPPSPDILSDEEAADTLARALSWVTSADIRLAEAVARQCGDRCRGREDTVECIRQCIKSEYTEREEKYLTDFSGYSPGSAVRGDLRAFGLEV
jgi:hypothetical protein